MKRLDDLLLFLGRLAMVALFLPDGIGKLESFSRFAASLGARGMAFPDVWAFLAVAGEIGGSILLILGFGNRFAAIVLVIFCVIANGLQHRYWGAPPSARNALEGQFYKDLALTGGLLFLYVAGPGAWGLERWLGWEAIRRRMRSPAS